MNYRIVLTAEAESNADEIYLWLAERSPQGAVNWFTAFLDAVDSLKVDPERRPLAPESSRFTKELRQLLFKTSRGRRYRILFHVDGESVYVVYVRGPGQAPIRE